MTESAGTADVFHLPGDWEIIGSGKNKYQAGLQNDYVVIDTSTDVITVLIYSERVDMRHITELASWSFVRKVKINEHDGYIHMHPEGYRKLLTWYCESTNHTYLVHFSREQDVLVRAFRRTNCH